MATAEIVIRLSDGQEVLAVITSAIDVTFLVNRKDYLNAEVAMKHLEVALKRLAEQCSPDLARRIKLATTRGEGDAVPHELS